MAQAIYRSVALKRTQYPKLKLDKGVPKDQWEELAGATIRVSRRTFRPHLKIIAQCDTSHFFLDKLRKKSL